MFDRFHPRYLVPNAVTAANLILALTAIVEASRGRAETAAWLIVWCALLDRVDGVVARWLGASSEFGIQFDTLSDLLAFCVAPGLLVYFLLTGDPRYAPMYESAVTRDRKSTRLNSSHPSSSYAVFCLIKKLSKT